MKVNQVAEILNEAINEIIGESAVIAEDLSNIVTIGEELNANSTINDNFDNFVSKIINKVGKTIEVIRDYKGVAPNILVDSWEYGSILEKIRVDVGDFQDNLEWDLNAPQTFDDLFGVVTPDVKAKYFNKRATFSLKMTYPRRQVMGSFQSPEKMMRFIANIENRIKTKLTVATDKLKFMTVANLIAEKLKSNNNVVNMLSLYNATKPEAEQLTKATALTNQDFLSFASGVILKYKEYVKGFSMLYNDEGYPTFTPEENLKIIMLADFATDLATKLYANTYNEQFVTIDGFQTVPYWQGTGTANDERDKISVIPASEGEAPAEGADTRETITQTGVMCVMFDEQAAMVCCEHPEIDFQRNAEKKTTNYFYTFDAMYFNDLGENCIVFVVADEASDNENAGDGV